MRKSKAASKKDRHIVGIAFEPELHAKIKEAADRDRRTLSQYVRLTLEKVVEEQKTA